MQRKSFLLWICFRRQHGMQRDCIATTPQDIWQIQREVSFGRQVPMIGTCLAVGPFVPLLAFVYWGWDMMSQWNFINDLVFFDEYVTRKYAVHTLNPNVKSACSLNDNCNMVGCYNKHEIKETVSVEFEHLTWTLYLVTFFLMHINANAIFHK